MKKNLSVTILVSLLAMQADPLHASAASLADVLGLINAIKHPGQQLTSATSTSIATALTVTSTYTNLGTLAGFQFPTSPTQTISVSNVATGPTGDAGLTLTFSDGKNSYPITPTSTSDQALSFATSTFLQADGLWCVLLAFDATGKLLTSLNGATIGSWNAYLFDAKTQTIVGNPQEIASTASSISLSASTNSGNATTALAATTYPSIFAVSMTLSSGALKSFTPPSTLTALGYNTANAIPVSYAPLSTGTTNPTYFNFNAGYTNSAGAFTPIGFMFYSNAWTGGTTGVLSPLYLNPYWQANKSFYLYLVMLDTNGVIIPDVSKPGAVSAYLVAYDAVNGNLIGSSSVPFTGNGVGGGVATQANQISMTVAGSATSANATYASGALFLVSSTTPPAATAFTSTSIATALTATSTYTNLGTLAGFQFPTSPTQTISVFKVVAGTDAGLTLTFSDGKNSYPISPTSDTSMAFATNTTLLADGLWCVLLAFDSTGKLLTSLNGATIGSWNAYLFDAKTQTIIGNPQEIASTASSISLSASTNSGNATTVLAATTYPSIFAVSMVVGTPKTTAVTSTIANAAYSSPATGTSAYQSLINLVGGSSKFQQATINVVPGSVDTNCQMGFVPAPSTWTNLQQTLDKNGMYAIALAFDSSNNLLIGNYQASSVSSCMYFVFNSAGNGLSAASQGTFAGGVATEKGAFNAAPFGYIINNVSTYSTNVNAQTQNPTPHAQLMSPALFSITFNAASSVSSTSIANALTATSTYTNLGTLAGFQFPTSPTQTISVSNVATGTAGDTGLTLMFSDGKKSYPISPTSDSSMAFATNTTLQADGLWCVLLAFDSTGKLLTSLTGATIGSWNAYLFDAKSQTIIGIPQVIASTATTISLSASTNSSNATTALAATTYPSIFAVSMVVGTPQSAETQLQNVQSLTNVASIIGVPFIDTVSGTFTPAGGGTTTPAYFNFNVGTSGFAFIKNPWNSGRPVISMPGSSWDWGSGVTMLLLAFDKSGNYVSNLTQADHFRVYFFSGTTVASSVAFTINAQWVTDLASYGGAASPGAITFGIDGGNGWSSLEYPIALTVTGQQSAEDSDAGGIWQ